MILTDITGFSKESHKEVNVKCDFNITDKCRGTFVSVYRDVLKMQNRNNGKDICIYCSRRLKCAGRNNPNSKYEFDDNFFNNIDSDGKAYLLGWIASDGHIAKTNSVTIAIHKKDEEIFRKFNEILGTKIETNYHKTRPMVKFSFNSLQASKDICKHLSISPGRKCETVQFPEDLQNDKNLGWAFIRGIFDGDGGIGNTFRVKQ